MKIAFDVDNTLIDREGRPIWKTISIFMALSKLPDVEMVVWSGGGAMYAANRADKLNLPYRFAMIKDKSCNVDLCFDDQEVDLAKVNIRV